MRRLQFWGAARTVTGSMHLLEVGSRKILLDCGIYQGRRKEAFEINRRIPFDPKEIDAVVLSHAHIDHSGNLPSLVRGGFRGPIYCTSATRDLAVFLLIDSAEIQVSDVAYVNRKRKREGRAPFEPLYTPHDARETIRLFRTIDYHEPFQVTENVTCEFYDAGHMLGSASVCLDLKDDSGNVKRLVFSGDVGRAEIPILRTPEPVPNADCLILESTYGDRSHQAGGDATAFLLKLAKEAHESRGKLLIPAFSVGRTQEIVYRLNELAESRQLPDLPVFVDSPLAIDATGVFQAHPECFDDESFERLLMEEDQDPLAFQGLYYVRKASQSRQLNQMQGPAIIIASSGMCESGRIIHHLKHHLEKPNTTVLFTGFQAPHTLGRKILDGHQKVSVFGSQREVRARIERLESTSGHADREELLNWAKAVAESGSLKQTMLVHGDVRAAESLQQLLQENGFQNVNVPDRGESFDI